MTDLNKDTTLKKILLEAVNSYSTYIGSQSIGSIHTFTTIYSEHHHLYSQ